MLDDADDWLDVFGVGLALLIVVGLVVVGLSFAGSGSDNTPQAEWDIERVNGTHVQVTHAGGEPVRRENLLVTVNSLRRATNWSDPVARGASENVSAGPDALVRVVWAGGRGDRTVMARERL
jgi:hypothetical protein